MIISNALEIPAKAGISFFMYAQHIGSLVKPFGAAVCGLACKVWEEDGGVAPPARLY